MCWHQQTDPIRTVGHRNCEATPERQAVALAPRWAFICLVPAMPTTIPVRPSSRVGIPRPTISRSPQLQGEQDVTNEDFWLTTSSVGGAEVTRTAINQATRTEGSLSLYSLFLARPCIT